MQNISREKLVPRGVRAHAGFEELTPGITQRITGDPARWQTVANGPPKRPCAIGPAQIRCASPKRSAAAHALHTHARLFSLCQSLWYVSGRPACKGSTDVSPLAVPGLAMHTVYLSICRRLSAVYYLITFAQRSSFLAVLASPMWPMCRDRQGP